MTDLTQNSYLDVRNPTQPQGEMTLKCSDIADGSTLSDDYVANIWGYTGGNVSPGLVWDNAPADTKSFVLTMYDPDAPTGSGFWHWNVFNIPADWKNGFIGAFPPKGDKPHRYIFTLYALNDTLDLSNDISAAVLGFNLNGKVLAAATLTAYYGC